jgi:alpha-acetolactate decarboxylase
LGNNIVHRVLVNGVVICFSSDETMQPISNSAGHHLPLAGLLIFLVFAGCKNSQYNQSSNKDAAKPHIPSVEHYGPMREVMREGKTESRIRLAEVVAKPNAFAVGALEGLAGEVTIIDGDVWVSRVAPNGSLSITGPELFEGDSATLISISHIAKWHSTKIKSTATGTDLENLIEGFARSMGLNTDKPFPFKIEGSLKLLDMHVINGYCPIATNPDTQKRKPWRSFKFDTAKVTIAGFYAANSVAVMTHHGTKIHAHAIGEADGKQIMGHIDAVTVEPGMVLFVPNRNSLR